MAHILQIDFQNSFSGRTFLPGVKLEALTLILLDKVNPVFNSNDSLELFCYHNELLKTNPAKTVTQFITNCRNKQN